MSPIQYTNALSAEFCNEMISEFEKSDNIVVRKRKEYSFKELMMSGNGEYLEMLQQDLIHFTNCYIEKYIRENNIQTFPKRYGYEAVRIKRYDAKDADEFPWHADVNDYISARRFLIMMYYLNDNFAGGETDFGSENEIKFTVQPKEGKLVIFPPFWTHQHRGRKLIDGSKYIVNVYLHYI